MKDIDNRIINKAYLWQRCAQGINVVPILDRSGIKDENLRDNIYRKELERDRHYSARGNNTDKTWYEPVTKNLYVYLPNIASEPELDTLLLERVTYYAGLSAILSQNGVDELGKEVFDNLRPDVQDKLLAPFAGSLNNDHDRESAGKHYLSQCIESVTTAEDKGKAFSHWKFLFHRYVINYKAGFWNSLSVDANTKANALAAGVRGHSFRISERRNQLRAPVTTFDIRDHLLRWNQKEQQNGSNNQIIDNPLDKYIDRLDYINMGTPSQLFLSSAADCRTCQFELPASAFYGHPGDELGERYILPENGMKKDKHPFSIMDILDIKEGLDKPLAMFRSRDSHKLGSTVVMLPSRSTNTACPGNFCVAVSPKEITPVDNKGHETLRGSGRWVNHIDSVYPRGDMSFILFLSIPGLVTYLDPDFEEKWLKPAIDRIEAYYDKLFELEGIEKPSGQDLENLLFGGFVDYILSPEDIKNIDRSLVNSRERSGLLAEYAAYHTAVESATNIVRKFENPKIISNERILFNMGEVHRVGNGEARLVRAIAKRIDAAGVPTHVVPADDPVLSAHAPVDGRLALGYSDGREIFLSEDGCTLETTFHEYTHVWAEAIRLASPETWESIVKTLTSMPEWDEVLNDNAYSGLLSDMNDVASEVLARISGKDNAKRINDLVDDEVSLASLASDIASSWVPSLDKAGSSRYSITESILSDILTGRHLNISPKRNLVNDTSMKYKYNMQTISKVEAIDYLQKLSYDDKMAMFSFFSQKEALLTIDEEDSEIIVKAYKTAIEVPVDVPDYDEDMIRESISTSFNLAIEKLSEKTIGILEKHYKNQLRVAKIESATNIHIEIPERANTLLALSRSNEGAQMLEEMYLRQLNLMGIQPLSIQDVQDQLHAQADQAKAAIILNANSKSLNDQLRNLDLKEGDTIFIRDEFIHELKTMVISDFEKEPFLTYSLRYAEDTISAYLRDDGSIRSCITHPEIGTGAGTDYVYSKSGMLLSATNDGITCSPAHAIQSLSSDYNAIAQEMNILELHGFMTEVAQLREPISYFKAYFAGEDNAIGLSAKYRIEEYINSFEKLQADITKHYEKAMSEFMSYANRGFRENNTLWDRITGKSFNKSYPLPDLLQIKMDEKQYTDGAVSIQEISEGKIPVRFYEEFLRTKGCEETNLFPSHDYVTPAQPVFIKTGIITEEEIIGSAVNFKDQLEISGRIDGPVSTLGGELVLVQKDDDGTLITLFPSQAEQLIDSFIKDGKIEVDGEWLSISLEEIKNLSYGAGQYLPVDESREKAYVVLDIKSQRPVFSTSFDTIRGAILRANRDKAYEKKQNESLNKTKTKDKSKGKGMSN